METPPRSGGVSVGQLSSPHGQAQLAASARYPSPFQSAAIPTMDSVGEWAIASIGRRVGNHLAIEHPECGQDRLGLAADDR